MRKLAMFLLIASAALSFNLPKVKMNPLQREIIETALSMVGGEYEWGAYDPKNRRFDCWNFVTWVFHHVLDKDGGVKHMLIGIDDPLWVFFKDPKVLKPADVLMNGGEHTVGFHAGIYYGKGFTIEARGGRYGIGIFRIEGKNPRCPFGETGYRFCFYSLLARLWLDPKPDFPYVYVKYDGNFFFSDEGAEIELHAYSPKDASVDIAIKIRDYQTGKVLKKFVLRRSLKAKTEIVENVDLNLEGLSGFVYFEVDLVENGKVLFEYDTYIKGHVEII